MLSDMMKPRNCHLQDFAAAAVAIVSVIGIIVLAALADPIPESLVVMVGAAGTWLFIRSGASQVPIEPPRQPSETQPTDRP